MTDWWVVLSDPSEVIPLGDRRTHRRAPDCWCHPTEDEGVIVHNSADEREEYERGRKPQ